VLKIFFKCKIPAFSYFSPRDDLEPDGVPNLKNIFMHMEYYSAFKNSL
jgi:hypothetical protein